MATVLVTNDDGIQSAGLAALAAAAVALGHEVIVAAPARQYSGASASILGTREDGHIGFSRVQLEGVPHATCFSVEAAPALIALIAAHGAFGAKPELVLSGINHGANVGKAILHSGTVGAALTGGVNGARGLAVSLDVGMDPEECHWGAPLPFVRELLPVLTLAPPGTVFNLNAPNRRGAIELRETPLASFGIVQTTMTDSTEGAVRLAVAEGPAEHEIGSDAAVLAQGYATVTSVTTVTGSPTPALLGTVLTAPRH